MPRFSKQDRINQLEMWLENLKKDLEISELKRQRELAWYARQRTAYRDRLTVCRKALGAIVERVNRSRFKPIEEVHLRDIAKKALEESK